MITTLPFLSQVSNLYSNPKIQLSMSSFFLLGIILPAIFLISAFFVSLFSKSSKKYKKLPPGSTGWPLIGESISFGLNPEKFVHERMIKYSPDIFQTSIAGKRVAVICGAAGNKFVFSNDNKSIQPWWPKIITTALTFHDESSIPLVKHPDHTFLKVDSMKHHIPTMDSEIQHHIEKRWLPYKTIKAHDLAKEVTFSLGCRLFISHDEDEVKHLVEPFFAVFRGIMSAPVNIPGTPFHGAMKGGRMAKERLMRIIKQRKQDLSIDGSDAHKGTDMLTRLILDNNPNKIGKILNLEEIANQVIGYLLASFIATSNAIAYTLGNLAEHPHIYEQVLKEQQEVAKSKAPGELLERADVQKMKYTWNVVCESMRLSSPTLGTFKEVLTDDLSFSGYDIPKGWMILWTPHTTHKDPKYFPNPEKFDPTRFEGAGPTPCTFTPFGGGPHMCGGKEYARLQALVFVHNIVTRFKLKKVNPNEKIIYNPDPTPVEGLPLYIELYKK